MNSADQQTHRTKTAQLEARIVVLETVTDDLARYLAKWAPAIGSSLEAHATDLETQRELQTQHSRGLFAQQVRLLGLEQVIGRTFSQRLRWLVTGR